MTMPRSSMSVGGWGAGDIAYANGSFYDVLLNELLEYVPELTWPSAGNVYERMRNDGQLAGALRAYMLPIRRALWALDDAGCRPTVTKLVADDLGLPVLGKDPKQTGARRRRFQWGDHLRVSLLDGVFGHMPFEQTYDTSDGASARLLMVRERMPKTINRILLDDDDQIAYVEQPARGPDPAPRKINANALVWYVNDREGADWRGRSLLRPSYPYWLIKDQMLRVHATSNRRWGMGVPVAQALPGTNPTPAEMDEAARYVQNFKASENAGGSMPPKFRMALEGMTGTVPDTLAFVRYLDQQMSTSLLTQWLNLGTTETGARSLAEVFVDMFMQSIQDFGDQHADQATAQIVVPLVDANFGADEPAPRIVCGNVGANHAVTAEAIAALYGCGALSYDPVLENYIRELYKLPKRDLTNVPAQPPAVPDPTPPVDPASA